MSADLILTFEKPFSFVQLLQETHIKLTRLLNFSALPSLDFELPPAIPDSNPLLESTSIDSSFPGAYIRFRCDRESVVIFHVFKGSRLDEEVLVGVGTVPTPASEVLGAALAAAVAQLMGDTTIGDSGHNWIDKDEYKESDLITALALQIEPADFIHAVELVHAKQAICKRGR